MCGKTEEEPKKTQPTISLRGRNIRGQNPRKPHRGKTSQSKHTYEAKKDTPEGWVQQQTQMHKTKLSTAPNQLPSARGIGFCHFSLIDFTDPLTWLKQGIDCKSSETLQHAVQHSGTPGVAEVVQTRVGVDFKQPRPAVFINQYVQTKDLKTTESRCTLCRRSHRPTANSVPDSIRPSPGNTLGKLSPLRPQMLVYTQGTPHPIATVPTAATTTTSTKRVQVYLELTQGENIADLLRRKSSIVDLEAVVCDMSCEHVQGS
jgi:hypothetical protein